MKTVKIFSALIFTMILISVNAGFAKNTNDNNLPTVKPIIHVMYQVIVHHDTEKSFCNMYQIEIIDGPGRQIVPPQVFIPGTTTYKFYEQPRLKKDYRTARLVEIPSGSHSLCPNDFYTAPDTKVIEFKDGDAYQFDLYPKKGSGKAITE